MPQKPRLVQLPLVGIIFLCVLAIVYQGYLVAVVNVVSTSFFGSNQTIVEHPTDTSSAIAISHWNVVAMRDAIDADQQVASTSDAGQQSIDLNATAVRKQGQAPKSGDAAAYPLSTVGKLFFSNDAGQNMVCSGTAIISSNSSTVDTAGHCLYWSGAWVKNVIFCPRYNSGAGPYGCWAARDLEVPSDWVRPSPNDYHHDMGMAIVSANDQGLLTDLVGGAGWGYNQAVNQPFSAYGYPAGAPFDGQTMKSCESTSGTSWKHGGGTVVSIPCNMTGGSSGGPWFIKDGSNWYLDGHNDFTSSIQPGHMFSPYYDDTWFALYNKAQQS